MDEKTLLELIGTIITEDTKISIDERYYAMFSIANAAQIGEDISSAVRALEYMLGSWFYPHQQVAALAIAFHCINKREGEKIEGLFKVHHNIIFEVVCLFHDAAEKGRGITPLAAALGSALKYRYIQVALKAADALKCAAEKGHDITPAIAALGDALSIDDVCFAAADALKCAAEKGQDITPAAPALEKFEKILNDMKDDPDKRYMKNYPRPLNEYCRFKEADEIRKEYHAKVIEVFGKHAPDLKPNINPGGKKLAVKG